MNEAIAALVRRHDPDRFLTALFAPPEKRDALLTAVFEPRSNTARTKTLQTGFMRALALIRLQWWREAVEGPRRRHEVAEPLFAAIAAGAFRRDDLLALIDAREVEAEPAIATMDDWRAYLLSSAGGLAVAAARLLGAPDPEGFRRFGAAYGLAGVLRSVAAHARQGRCMLPEDVLADHGLTREQVIAAPASAHAVMQRLVNEGVALAGGKVRLPRQVVAAALPVVLARRDFRRVPGLTMQRGLGDRMAATLAGLTGRI